ncbi:radical SAM protein [[Clostridium] cellulosi]|uniref:Radical SAM protein n=1 Tax=[Clostridium] cellulosi TaxID=29343 RepID=A0A078KID3_9FIRM|nr:radical SAM protein [[Clostridium] cellulosi]
MKPSRFNLIFDYCGKKIAFNSMTCALAEVDDDFFRILDAVKTNHDISNTQVQDGQLIQKMKDGGFIIDDDFDEISFLKYRSYQSKFGSTGLGLTIAPTLACNFACPYCYESAESGMMKQDVIDGIYSLVEKEAKRQGNISVNWYGGEPMLAKDLIFKMSDRFIEICDKYGVNYSAYMVTNGYLIDDNIADKLKKAHIKGMQVTIDGPADIHNARRKLKNSNNPTFDKILTNVAYLRKNGFNVSIRINIDKSNVDRLEELLDVLLDYGLKGISVNLGHVKAYTEACSSISETCLSTEEYASESLRYQKILHDKGFDSDSYPYYPGVKANYCCADSTSAFVIDPKGNLYKCWNDVGNRERRVGNIKDIDQQGNNTRDIMMNVNYLLWSPFDHKKCLECNILPICMGGCPYNGLKFKHDPECEKWKYNLIDVLKATYVQKGQVAEQMAEQNVS